MQSEDEYSCNILRMIKNDKEIFHLIKEDITIENIKMRELIPPRL